MNYREERNLTKWAKQRISEILETFNAEKNGVEFRLFYYLQFTITISSVEKCDGQATIVFSKVVNTND